MEREVWPQKGTEGAKRGGRQRSEVRSQKSEVRSQRSEVRGQKSEVRSQKSEVRGRVRSNLSQSALSSQRKSVSWERRPAAKRSKDSLDRINRIDRIKTCDHVPDGRDHASIACGKFF
jgi:hypothetical protein